MPESYMIVFEGKTRDGQDPAQVRNRLAELLRIQPAEASSLFSGVHLVLWRNLDLQTATALKAAVEKTGADCRIRRARTNGDAAPSTQPGPDPVAPQAETTIGASSDIPAPPVSSQAGAQVSEPDRQPMKDRQVTAAGAVCPKCGYQARNAADELLTLGQCPACAIVLSKYHPIDEPVPPAPVAPTAVPASRVPGGAQQETPIEPAWDENPENWEESEETGDWQLFSRGTAIASLIVGFALTVLPPWLVFESRPLRGLVFGIATVLLSCLAYQCYRFYLRKRGQFFSYVLFSLGIMAVLAVLGGMLYRVYSGVATFLSAPGWRSHVTFTRGGLLLSAAYLGAAIYLAQADQQKIIETTRLAEAEQVQVAADAGNLDARAYNEAVKKAKATFGQRFPKGERPAQYLYFKNVYVTTASSCGLEFKEMVQSLLPSFEVADFHTVLDSEIELMMFNAMGFRGELAVEGIVSGELQRSLESLAWAWAEPTGVESRPLSYAERVALFDAQCPMDELSHLAQ